MNYWIFDRDQQSGPYAFDQVKAMWNAGSLTADAQYSTGEEWCELRSLLVKPPAIPTAIVPAASPLNALPAHGHAFCHKCNCVRPVFVIEETSGAGKVAAVLMLLFLCIPLFWIPLVAMKEQVKRCKKCYQKIAS